MEFYQLLWVGFEVVLCVAVSMSAQTGVSTSWFGLVAVYRSYEIVLFALRWLLWDKTRIHNLKRSLVGFLVNLVEVVLLYAATYVAVGCVKCEDGF